MKRHILNSLHGNFILGWYMDNTSWCDKVIEYSKTAPDRTPGKMYTEKDSNVVNKNLKDSIDCALPYGPLLDEYYMHLDMCLAEYAKVYPYITLCDMVNVLEPPNVQHYEPGGGFKIWHSERQIHSEPVVSRHLVFMTYLNDLPDGGTEFYHQRVRIKAEKGLTVIWPADWTHCHRSQVSYSDEKYIATGWFNFIKTPEGFKRDYIALPEKLDW